jgi:hypothetical protein
MNVGGPLNSLLKQMVPCKLIQRKPDYLVVNWCSRRLFKHSGHLGDTRFTVTAFPNQGGGLVQTMSFVAVAIIH